MKVLDANGVELRPAMWVERLLPNGERGGIEGCVSCIGDRVQVEWLDSDGSSHVADYDAPRISRFYLTRRCPDLVAIGEHAASTCRNWPESKQGGKCETCHGKGSRESAPGFDVFCTACDGTGLKGGGRDAR